MGRPRALLAGLTVAIFALAGCGGSSSNSGTTSGAGASGNQGGAGTAIAAASNPSLDKAVLVDSTGRTVYLFEKDESDESYCKGGCAKVWPAVTTSGKPKATGSVDASKLGTLKRDDGTTQVTYAGHPLYTYTDDHKPGQAEGNGTKEFGAEWYALEPSGAKAEESGGGNKS